MRLPLVLVLASVLAAGCASNSLEVERLRKEVDALKGATSVAPVSATVVGTPSVTPGAVGDSPTASPVATAAVTAATPIASPQTTDAPVPKPTVPSIQTSPVPSPTSLPVQTGSERARPSQIEIVQTGSLITATVRNSAGELLTNIPVVFTFASNIGAVSHPCVMTVSGRAQTAFVLRGSTGVIIATANWNTSGAAAICTSYGTDATELIAKSYAVFS